MNVFLTGYRATGKTSVARSIAEQLDMPWFDSDRLIEEAAEMSIADLFALESEEGFRDRETAVIRQLAEGENQIVSLGGGAIVRPENRKILQGRGMIVWLQASADKIYERLTQDPQTECQRPDLTAQGGIDEIRILLQRRQPWYESVADFFVNTDDLSPPQVAARIIQRMG
ncbi:MAG: shikimate kinase [Planctomycetota bacterium]|nr:shikimate kinase [Planctomycetota bacterium]